MLAGGVSAYLHSAGGYFDSERLAQPPRLHQGLVASGDQFVSCAQAAGALRADLLAAGHDVLAVEMEGAAVAQVCVDYGVPFAAVRAISDRPDDGAHVDVIRVSDCVASPYYDDRVRGLPRVLC